MIKKLPFVIFFLLSWQIVFAQSELSEAKLLLSSSQFKPAQILLQDFVDQKPRQDFELAEAAYLLSYSFLQLQNYEHSKKYNNLSLQIKEKLNYEFVAGNYMRMGTIELRQQQYEKALDHYLYALDLPHEDEAFSAILYGYLGLTCAKMNRFKKAKEFYQNSQETFKTVYDEPHADLVNNWLQIGKVELAEGNFDEAKESFSKALQLDELVDTTRTNPRRIAINNALGALHFYYYEKDTIALQHYKAARDISNNVWGDNHPESIRTLSNMAEVFLYRSNLKQARHVIHAALKRVDPQWGNTNSTAMNNEAVLFTDKALLAHLYNLDAKIAMEFYQGSKADEELQNAYGASEKAASVFENWLNNIQGEITQTVLLQQNVDVYEMGIQAAYELSFSTGDNTWIEKAFLLSERSKASILKRMMIRLNAFDQLPEAEQLVAQTKSLQASVSGYEVQLSEDYSNAALRKDLLNAKKEYADFVRSVEQKYPDYFEKRFDQSISDIGAIQQHLDDESVMLSYYLGTDLYYIFGLSNNSMSAFAFPQDSILEGYDKKKKMKSFDFADERLKIFEKIGGEVSSQLTKDFAPVSLKDGVGAQLAAIKRMQKEEFAHFSNRMYGKLIYPMEGFIRRKKHLIIIPHGELCYLPFEAVTKTKAVGNIKFSKLDYLIKDFAITYHYSAELFHRASIKRNERPIREANFLGIAPVFSSDETAGYVWDSRDYILEDSFYNRETSMRSSAMFGDQLRPLLNSQDEILGIAKRFARKRKDSKALLHQEATEEAFKREVPHYTYVHVASHSFADPINPRLSGVIFANYGNKENDQDGILHAPETFLLNVNADLLVLSSCESGVGKYVEGEGLMSLTRGFLYAGAHNMVCSMWKVYDSYTKTLMIKFYDNILSGDNYSKALRKAKLKMIKKEKTAHPRKWSGFVLIGVE